MSVAYEVVHGAIARIHWNRPKTRNSIGPDDARQILEYLKRAVADESVRVVVFSGEGDDFSSGADMVEYGDIIADARGGKRPISDLMAVLNVTLETNRLLRNPNILSIAAAKGWTVGQGLELCIASDFIVASEDAKFYFAETQIGVTMTSGCAKLLPQMVGLANARRLMLFGEKLPAAEAQRIGLVAKVVPKGQELDAALEMAKRLAAGAPLALATQKRLLDAGASMDLAAVQDLEVHTSMWISLTEDALEADRAFTEKRPPRFRGA
jgi:enoyl-CoA hydratase